ncbi:hypothetical protein GCM10008959_09590 [Deinococcus seoulensis]|uniref:Uncharacterized protein n=1 Tax=Deinococcus seoulensis TaxID=1837379 RepID=A0ABQ2RQL5_9DEIO|nr:hypothetical protein [Deinococcus seoulensis]GGR50445.1 hypothetical protein GCM10008959_09590 [Deinococcus seoulensis]
MITTPGTQAPQPGARTDTDRAAPHTDTAPTPPGTAPLRLNAAARQYLAALDRPAPEAALLTSLDAFLGTDAPLLAYTRLTGEAWKRSLPPTEHTRADALLTHFRAFLRDHGWLDRARPVNQPD